MPLPNKQVCPTEEQLIDFLGSDGHSGEQASLASHVAECALCADAVQRLLSGEREEDQPTFEQRPDGRVAQADIETSRPETSVEMSPAPPSPHGAPSLSDPAELSVTERYVKLRLHDRGGLGEVFVAEDCELHRQVALKQIQEKFAENAESRERFVREAEVTGGLEHPGIVPVYGLGQYPDGRPYYAMRFIRGDTLKSHVDDYHEQSFPRSSTDGTLQFQGMLRHFIAVCQAIEYAHSRSIVHRDLKPANIMIGKFGETLVVDWGLAKPAGVSEPGTGAVHEPLVTPASGVAATAQGSVMGTPAYMSPEQAAGREQLGPATDVYSLGATLYEVITGVAPFDGPAFDVLDRVQQGALARPRQVSPSVPRPLEAICLKAMARDTSERYGSAAELAQDLERYLADEPVTALPDPFSVRCRRWIQRHRALVVGTAAAALVALVTVSAGFAIVSRKNRALDATNAELREQRLLAIEQRDRAEQALSLALDATSNSNRLSMNYFEDGTLRQAASLAKQNVDLLEQLVALGYDDALRPLALQHHNQALLLQASFAERHRAQLQSDLNRIYQTTAAHYERAAAVYDRLIAARPNDIQLAFERADTHAALIGVYTTLEQDKRAQSMERLALNVLEPLAAAEPTNVSYQLSLSTCYSNAALLRSVQGRQQEALTMLDRVVRNVAHPLYLEPSEPEAMRNARRARYLFQTIAPATSDPWPNEATIAASTPTDVRDVQLALLLATMGFHERAREILDRQQRAESTEPNYQYAFAAAVAASLPAEHDPNDALVAQAVASLAKYAQPSEPPVDNRERIAARTLRLKRIREAVELAPLRRHSAWKQLADVLSVSGQPSTP